MRRIFLYLFFIVLSVGSISTGGVLRALSPETGSTSVAVMGRQLYEEMRLDQWVCFDAFMQGLRGSEKIDRKNKDILTLIDFSKPYYGGAYGCIGYTAKENTLHLFGFSR